jgi:hypothetical protein
MFKDTSIIILVLALFGFAHYARAGAGLVLDVANDNDAADSLYDDMYVQVSIVKPEGERHDKLDWTPIHHSGHIDLIRTGHPKGDGAIIKVKPGDKARIMTSDMDEDAFVIVETESFSSDETEDHPILLSNRKSLQIPRRAKKVKAVVRAEENNITMGGPEAIHDVREQKSMAKEKAKPCEEEGKKTIKAKYDDYHDTILERLDTARDEVDGSAPVPAPADLEEDGKAPAAE